MEEQELRSLVMQAVEAQLRKMELKAAAIDKLRDFVLAEKDLV